MHTLEEDNKLHKTVCTFKQYLLSGQGDTLQNHKYKYHYNITLPVIGCSAYITLTAAQKHTHSTLSVCVTYITTSATTLHVSIENLNPRKPEFPTRGQQLKLQVENVSWIRHFLLCLADNRLLRSYLEGLSAMKYGSMANKGSTSKNKCNSQSH